MAKTRELVSFHLPEAIMGLTMHYFESPRRVWFDMAVAGEFESCSHCPPERIEDVLRGACAGRNKELVQWAIDNRAKDINSGLLFAIHSGALDMVRLTIEKGANDFDRAVETCIEFDKPELLSHLLNFPLKSFADHLESAGLNGKFECMKVLVAHKPFDMEPPGCASVIGGNLDCVKLCIAHGSKNFGYMFAIACCNHNADLLEYLRDKVKKLLQKETMWPLSALLLCINGCLLYLHGDKWQRLVHVNVMVLSLLFDYGIHFVTVFCILYLMVTQTTCRDWIQLMEPLARHCGPFALLGIVLMVIETIRDVRAWNRNYRPCPWCGY